MKKYLMILAALLFFAGCDINMGKKGGGGGGDNENSSPVTLNENNETNETDKTVCVNVATIGNIVNAVVRDSNGQNADYNTTLSKYCFYKRIAYPIKVQLLSSSYIDVDYDNKKTANDIKPKFDKLESYYPYIDLITDMHAKAVDDNFSSYQQSQSMETNETNESNVTNVAKKITLDDVKKYYEKIINDKYSVDLASAGLNEKILNFVAYDYNLTNPLNVNSNLFDRYNNLIFYFDNELNKDSIKDKVKYYSFFHSLELLDKKLIERVDTIHRPEITYLHPSNSSTVDNFINIRTNFIAKDIKRDNYGVYTASGVDGVSKLDNKLKLMNNYKVNNTFSNSYKIDILKTKYKSYLVTADGGEGISLFDITNGAFFYLNKIFWKYYDESQDTNVSVTIDDTAGMKQIDEIISVKSYVSPFENKMWLAFGTKNKGLYLVDFKKIIPFIEGNLSYPMIVSNVNDDVNNTLWIAGDGDTVYSEEFSSDGESLYATKGNMIESYDLSSLTGMIPSTYTVKSENAYNLKMITNNGADELFVSTNRGVEVYDVLNNYDLAFKSAYNTSGANVGYLPKMSFISDKNILLFTDGYQGLKAIKYDESYNPQLCGIGYFYPYSDSTKLAKVTSVDSYKDNSDGNYYVIVGVDGFGIAKFKLNDLLFKHCQ